MKFISRKYRECQTDWFGKRGIPWHVTVVMRKRSDGKYETLTLCHVFRSCSQDSCAVLSVMSDVLAFMQCVHYWQDNTGCYHCADRLAQLIKRRITVREVKGSNLAGPETRVLK